MAADGALKYFDANLANGVYFRLYNRKNIEFQFPPKITGENNSSSWMEIEVWSHEPLRIHKGSIGRRLNMEWEYIATDRIWNPTKIGTELRKLKSYFYEFQLDGGERVYPLAVVQYMQVIPIRTGFRIRDLNITYGPEIVGEDGDYSKSHPLYSKVIVQLELATNLSPVSGKSVEEVTEFLKGEGAKEKLRAELKPPNFAWY